MLLQVGGTTPTTPVKEIHQAANNVLHKICFPSLSDTRCINHTLKEAIQFLLNTLSVPSHFNNQKFQYFLMILKKNL